MVRLLNKVCEILNRIVVILASGFLLAMFAIIVSNAVMRYIFNSSLLWAYDVLRVLMVGLVFFAASVVYYRKEHIRFVFLYEIIPSPVRKWFEVLMHSLYFILFLVLGIKGLQFSIGAWSIKLAASGVSNFWLYIFLSFSMIVMVFFTLKSVAELLMGAGEEAAE